MTYKNSRPFFFDIDGTLTTVPTRKWGPPIEERLAAIRQLVVQNYQVVLWTGGGTGYAREFAEAHRLGGLTCIGKPEALFDDNPTIRPRDRMPLIAPDQLVGFVRGLLP